MIKLECKYCKKKFSVFPYRLKRKDSKVKYCSSECYHNDFIGSKMSKKTRKKMSESHEKPIWLENQTPWNKGKKGLQKAWNKGTGKNFITTDGYKKIWKNNKRYLEHRFIMEEYLERKLKNNEIVHHINENRLDNKIENLQVMTKSEHTKLHMKLYWKLKK